MKYRKRVLLVLLYLIIVGATSFIAYSWFTSIDTNKNSYLHIGKLKPIPQFIKGRIYYYNNTDRIKYKRPSTWVNDLTYSILKNETGGNIDQIKNPLEVSYNMIDTLDNKVALFYVDGLAFENNFTKDTIKLELHSKNKKLTLFYDNLKPYIKFFNISNNKIQYSKAYIKATFVVIDVRTLITGTNFENLEMLRFETDKGIFELQAK